MRGVRQLSVMKRHGNDVWKMPPHKRATRKKEPCWNL